MSSGLGCPVPFFFFFSTTNQWPIFVNSHYSWLLNHSALCGGWSAPSSALTSVLNIMASHIAMVGCGQQHNSLPKTVHYTFFLSLSLRRFSVLFRFTLRLYFCLLLMSTLLKLKSTKPPQS